MGTDAARVNERHEAKQEVFDPRQCLTKLATSDWPISKTLCLKFIDAWGDTVFNQVQVPVLLQELRVAEQHQADPEVKAHLGKVARLVERAVDQVHTYIKFVGD